MNTNTSRRRFLQTTLSAIPAIPLIFDNQEGSLLESKNTPMKSLGLIGGTSWHSTVDYYRYINQRVNAQMGDKVNPPLILVNLNQAEIHHLQQENKWDEIANIYIEACKTLTNAGAEAIIFCANTPHKNYEIVQQNCIVPILHIADATGNAAQKLDMKKLILFGTKFTMTEPFIKDRLKAKYGIETVVPKNYTCEKFQEIISRELSMGTVNDDSKKYMLHELEALKSEETHGVILGCTELAMVIKPQDTNLTLLDTTELHAQMAVDFVLSK